jgi:NADH:ubiquinone oxidoreductase subunit 5 (subunit L)/multisubunit Na+/H+ antiporter MnhA subunit
MQEQSKRLLAFHSIGQVGYILLGLGTCLALLRSGWIIPAALAFYGAVFHTLNHGIFKSLLFLNTGSILYRTNTQDLNQLGGLMKYMPATAFTALVASFSIAGVPLFNGFASKWSLYVAAIEGGTFAHYLPVCAVIAILTSALTLASFIKFFGVSFLSRRSALVAEKALRQPSLEVGWLMRAPQLFLAALCVILGLAPMIAFTIIHAALNSSRQGLGTLLANVVPAINGPWAGLEGLGGRAVLAPMAMALVLALLFLVAYGLSRLGRAPRKTSVPWSCGYATDTDAHRYHAHHFYGDFKRYFRWIGGGLQPSHDSRMEIPPKAGNDL